MQCPDCGYMMTVFEKECPRCKTLKEKGLTPTKSGSPTGAGSQSPSASTPPDLPVQTHPPLAPDHLPVEQHSFPIAHTLPQDKRSPRPLRVVASESPATVEPAPLIIYENRPLRWKPYAAAVALMVLLAGCYIWWRMAQDAATRAMVTAAREGACQRMPGFDTDRDQQACVQLSSAMNYTVTHEGDSAATVTFFLNGVTSSMAVQINRDQAGDWHAVSAKEGDEGSRHEYDRSLVPTWEHHDPPPTTEIGGPTVPDSAPAPVSTSPNTTTGSGEPAAPTEPAGPAGPSSPSSSTDPLGLPR